MAYSLQLYTGDGVQTTFSFSFPYLDRDHVKVEVDGSLTFFTFLSDNLISISPAPAVDSVVQIYRETPKTRLVDFLNGSIQDAEDFDLDSNQLLYIVLEGFDEANKSLSRVPVSEDNSMYVDIDLNGLYKIINSAAPTEPTDLVRLQDLADIAGITVPDASEATKGIIRIATQAEVDAGLSDVTAVTPAKLRGEINSTYADSVAYTDASVSGVESSAVATANTYTDTAVAGAESNANTYTDGQISTLTTYVDTQDASTLSSANAYTDAQIAAIPSGGSEVGDVKESYATLDSSWVLLDNSSFDTTVYPGLAPFGFDKVSGITSSYDPTGRTGYPSNASVPARSTSYSLVLSNGNMYYESAPNVWTQSTTPELFLSDAGSDVVAVDGNNVAARSATTGNVLYSTDGGATFSVSDTGSLSSISVLMYTNGLLVAIASSGSIVYVSADNGATWDNIDAIAQTGLDHSNTVPTNSGFAVFASDVIYTYDVVNTPAGVFLTNTVRHRIVSPASSQVECITYNAERNTVAIIYNDNDTVDTAVIVTVDLATQKSYSTYVEVVSETFLTIHRFIWVGGDSYVISHNNGVTFVTIENTVSAQQISQNLSTQISTFTFGSVAANVSEGYVVCARTSGGIPEFDIFAIGVDLGSAYLPHNPSVGIPKYIKAS